MDRFTQTIQNLASNIFPKDELIYAFPVQSHQKKGKTVSRILCLTTKNNKTDVSVRLHTIGALKKGGYEKKEKHKLKRLSKIEVKETNSLANQNGRRMCFLYFTIEKPVVFEEEYASKEDHSLEKFLLKVITLCSEHFGNIPALVGISKMELSLYATDTETVDGVFSSTDEQTDFMSEEEEKLLSKVLNQYSLDMSDVKIVNQVLTQELDSIETDNIHDLLEKQAEWENIVSHLAETRSHLGKLKQSLDSYHTKLKEMKADIFQIEDKNNEMELQSRNHEKLAQELSKLKDQLDFGDHDVKILRNHNFESETEFTSITKRVQKLEEAITCPLKKGMDKMKAVMERRTYLKQLRKEFADRVVSYLSTEFQKRSSVLKKDAKKNSSKDPPEQREIIYELVKFGTLMKSVKAADIDGAEYYGPYIQLLKKYSTAMRDPFMEQFKILFQQTQRLIQRNKESSKSNMFVLGGKMTISAQGMATLVTDFDDESSIGSSLSIIHGDDEDLRVDIAFSSWLNIISEIVYTEEKFCASFFHLADKVPFEAKQLHSMLSTMFDILTSKKDLSTLSYIAKKTDLFYSLSMMSDVEEKLKSFGNTQFLALVLENIKNFVNTNLYLRFIDEQINSIKNFRKVLIKRLTVVPYFAKFPQFMDKIESNLIFDGGIRDRKYVEEVYDIVVKQMFESLSILSKSDSKHTDAFLLKNYAYFKQIIGQKNKLSKGVRSEGLQKYVEFSEKCFEENLQSYILTGMINYRFDQLFSFFEGIEECLKTIDANDVSFQPSFSKNKLNALLDQTQKSIEKSIDDLYCRMNKHIGPLNSKKSIFKVKVTEYNLFAMIWNKLKNYLLSRITDFETLMKKCYGSNSIFNPDTNRWNQVFKQVEAKHQHKNE